jgi:nitrite reductase/ring-hydroxylating ferredoxin subunit
VTLCRERKCRHCPVGLPELPDTSDSYGVFFLRVKRRLAFDASTTLLPGQFGGDMDHPTQVSLSRTLLAMIEQRQTSMANDIFLNPVESYTSLDQQRREQQHLFGSRPLMIGLGGQLAYPGDFLTDDLSGVPVLVVRDNNGSLNAFINVCRHRGARLLNGSGNIAGAMTCPYHGWAYGLDGQLQRLNPPGSFEGLSCTERNLTRLSVLEQHGLIWVHPTPGGQIDETQTLGLLTHEVQCFGFQHYSHYQTRRLRRRFNWKVVVDTFLENWHFSTLHRQTVLPIFLPGISHFEGCGQHLRLIMPRRSIVELFDQPEEQWDLLRHSAIMYVLFPNTLLVWQGDHLEVWRVFAAGPRCVDQCLIEVSLHVPAAPTSAKEKTHWDKNMILLMDTVDGEDFQLAKYLQKGYVSHAQQYLTFGRNEPALQHFHRAIRAAIDEGEN